MNIFGEVGSNHFTDITVDQTATIGGDEIVGADLEVKGDLKVDGKEIVGPTVYDGDVTISAGYKLICDTIQQDSAAGINISSTAATGSRSITMVPGQDSYIQTVDNGTGGYKNLYIVNKPASSNGNTIVMYTGPSSSNNLTSIYSTTLRAYGKFSPALIQNEGSLVYNTDLFIFSSDGIGITVREPPHSGIVNFDRQIQFGPAATPYWTLDGYTTGGSTLTFQNSSSVTALTLASSGTLTTPGPIIASSATVTPVELKAISTNAGSAEAHVFVQRGSLASGVAKTIYSTNAVGDDWSTGLVLPGSSAYTLYNETNSAIIQTWGKSVSASQTLLNYTLDYQGSGGGAAFQCMGGGSFAKQVYSGGGFNSDSLTGTGTANLTITTPAGTSGTKNIALTTGGISAGGTHAGSVILTGGDQTSTASGSPGGVVLQGGNAVHASAVGGGISLIAGNSVGTSSTGGGISLVPGTGTSANGVISMQGTVDMTSNNIINVANINGSPYPGVSKNASARYTSSANISNSNWVGITLGSVQSNTGSITYSGIDFILPSSGWYVMSAQAYWDVNSTGIRAIGIGNTGYDNQQQQRTPAPTSDPAVISVMFIGLYTAGDGVHVNVLQESGGNLNCSVQMQVAQLFGT